jgi:hypothetical protein
VARPSYTGTPQKIGEFPNVFDRPWSAIRPKGARISARDRLGEVKICSAVYQTPSAALRKPPGPPGVPQLAETPHQKNMENTWMGGAPAPAGMGGSVAGTMLGSLLWVAWDVWGSSSCCRGGATAL